jgi:ABC-type nitrate/sulfonate/bicarbonate transport system permease component
MSAEALTGTAHRGWKMPAALRKAAPPVLTGLALLVAWEIASRADTIYWPRRDVPAPTDIVRALYDLVQTSYFWDAVAQTLKGTALGLGFALIVAVPLGIAIGSSRVLFRGTRAVIEFLRPIPGLTMLPLLVLVIGIGFNLKLALVGLGCFWPLLVQSIYGVQDVDPMARDTARAYRLGQLRTFGWIVLPSALPYIVTGFRLAAILALNLAIGTELLVGSTQGMGDQMNKQQLANQVPAMYGYIVAAALIGLLINIGVRRLERYLLHWHASQREGIPL